MMYDKLSAIMMMTLAACSAAQTDDPAVAVSSEVQAILDDSERCAQDCSRHTYEVTIENLMLEQGLSPGVVATHTSAVDLFRVGERASEAVRLIAEDANYSVAVNDLRSNPAVLDVQPILLPPIQRKNGPTLPSTRSIQIQASGRHNRLSLTTMIICTNDGFTGLNNVRLPDGYRPETHYVDAYDAGTEENTEARADIIDVPCTLTGLPPVPPEDGLNSRVATSDVIRPHQGIRGIADLGLHLNWRNPVAKITIQRLR